MSTRDELYQAIRRDGLTPVTVDRLASGAQELWHNSPSVASFTAWGVFHAVAARWDDNQAAPSDEFDRIQLRLVPKLDEWLRTDASFHDSTMIDDTIAVLHVCLRS